MDLTWNMNGGWLSRLA